MQAWLFGFSLGLPLILAIGAQNAFVLRQGLRNEHLLLVCLICVLSDALLIIAGVAGFHALIERFPSLVTAARYGGAVFLGGYDALGFARAWGAEHGLDPAARAGNGAWQTALTCLALTWFNPHVYLDTVVLLGSVSTQFGDAAAHFGAGAIVVSLVFFFSLGYGARLLRPYFAQARAWRLLDFLIGCVMWGIAARLVFMD